MAVDKEYSINVGIYTSLRQGSGHMTTGSYPIGSASGTVIVGAEHQHARNGQCLYSLVSLQRAVVADNV